MKVNSKKKHKNIYILLVMLSIVVLILTIIKISDQHSPVQKKGGKNTKKVSIIKNTSVTPEQFGANGFDNKDDTKALQKAIDSSKIVILKTGATYLIDEPLISNHSISIKAEGKSNKAAVIVQKNEKSAFILNNNPIKSTFVSRPIYSNQSFVTLKSTKGIKPGDLLHLISNKLWYWDNRGYLKKGELHKVTKIIGKKVYLDRPTQENYNVSLGETVSATVYPNKFLEMKNISFSHPKAYNTVMVKVNYTSDAKFDYVSITNSKVIGLFLNSTFHTVIQNAHVNLGTTKEIKTGYGIQDYGGSGTFITKSTFIRARRGVDFSGDTPSRYGLVTNSITIGYRPGVLATGNSGFGTHSTAEFITFKNNSVRNCQYAFVSRGNNITFENNKSSGFSSSFAAVSFGNHVKLLNNSYTSESGSSLENFIFLPISYHGSLIAIGNTGIGIKGRLIGGNINQLQALINRGNIMK